MKVLDQKLKKVLNLRTDSPEMLESLDALSTFYRAKGNTLEARRSLRSDLEAEGLRLAEEFIHSFSDIESQFDKLNAAITTLHSDCSSVRERLESTESRTARFLTRAGELRGHRQRLETRLKSVQEFLTRFQLTDDELDALYASPIETDDGAPFFAALNRVAEIRASCKDVISSAQQAAGLEILESMAKHEEAAYNRLFSWVQSQCEELVATQDSEVSEQDVKPILRKALRVLSARPAYHRHCQDCVTGTRRAALVHRFIAALKRGGPGGLPRPIEVHAHDPLRFVGDMIAWIHQAIATEKEIVMGLFGRDRDQRGANEPPAAATAESSATSGAGGATSGRAGDEKAFEGSDESKAAGAEVDGTASDDDHAAEMVITAEEMLDRIFDGVVPPLKVRIDQVLASTPGLVMVFRLTDVVSFYADTMGQLLSPSAGLCRALLEAKAAGWKRFFDLVKTHSSRLLQTAPPYPSDLSTSRPVKDTLAKLGNILEVYQRSMVPGPEREEGFKEVLVSVLDPLLQMCRHSAEGLGLSDTAVFMLNNMTAMQSVLTPFDFTSGWVQRLASEMQQWEDTLIREEANEMLSRVGLTPKLRAIESHDGSAPLSGIKGLEAEALGTSLKAFYASLFSLVMPTFDRLSSPRLRVRARRGTSQIVASAYDTIYAAVIDPANAYGDAVAALVPHSPTQVRTLLDLDG